MLASLLPEAVWEADLDGRIRFMNQKGLEIMGYTEEDIASGVNGFDFYTLPGRQKCVERMMEVLKGDSSFITEYEMQRRDGTTFPALVHSELVRIDGNPAYFIGIGIDISERKRAELEHRHLVAAIEQSHEAVVITDAEGKILYVNPSFEMISGYSREEALGQNPRLLQSGEHSRSFYRSMWKVLTSGKTWQGSFVNRRKNGNLYNQRATISPVFDEAGEIINYVAVNRDITEELRINQEKAELEHQYHQARKMETVGLLAGGIAHDLNNLLTPILGYSEMIIEDPKASESGREYARIVLKAARGARDIVSSLLAFSRKKALDLQLVDLAGLLDGMRGRFKQILPDNVVVTLNLGEGIPEITGDSAQLEQVVTDLVKNAGEAMPGGGDLTIEAVLAEFNEELDAGGEKLDPGLYVSLKISDTGFGMDAQTRSQIFEPFFTTKPVGKGSGLGLATSYGIIRQHGGDIRVFSQPFQGTTFQILLPVAGDSFAAGEGRSETNGGPEGSPLILIVEDDEHVREMSCAVLRRRGYKVLTAETGEDALEILGKEKARVDLLLTDVVMPGISGKELYDLVAPKQPGMRVIFMSGYVGEVLASKGINGSSINFIQKPFSVQSLTNKIRNVLDQSEELTIDD